MVHGQGGCVQLDIFFGFSQVEVDGHLPSESAMFDHLVSQVRLADGLGFHTAWFGSAHYSLAEQQRRPDPVLPHFRGEMCLNTDILQLAHLLFPLTERIHLGSAVHNLFCNGGPVALAEAVATFLTLHAHRPSRHRRVYLGLGTGRFDFVNATWGVAPRSDLEAAAWGPLRGLILAEGLEIFLRLLRGEALASADVSPKRLTRSHFRSDADFEAVRPLAGRWPVEIPPFWTFDRLRIVPAEASLDPLRVVLGTHDPQVQLAANRFHPCRVFNLSVTRPEVIEATHARMAECFHPEGGAWRRGYMPRTVMVFVDDGPGGPTDRRARAEARARKAMEVYWRAMEGTVDQEKVARGIDNTVHGDPALVAEKMRARFHPDDTVMCWFDFADHDTDRVEKGMRVFWEQVRPRLDEGAV